MTNSKSFANTERGVRISRQRGGVRLSLLPLCTATCGDLQRTQAGPEPKAPEKTGALQKLRQTRVCFESRASVVEQCGGWPFCRFCISDCMALKIVPFEGRS